MVDVGIDPEEAFEDGFDGSLESLTRCPVSWWIKGGHKANLRGAVPWETELQSLKGRHFRHPIVVAPKSSNSLRILELIPKGREGVVYALI